MIEEITKVRRIVNLHYASPSICIYGLNAFQASFSVPKTPLAIILCSSVVFLTLSYEEKKKSDVDAHIRAHAEGVRNKTAHLVRM